MPAAATPGIITEHVHQATVDWYLKEHPEDGAQRIAEAKALGYVKVIDEQKRGQNGSNSKRT